MKKNYFFKVLFSFLLILISNMNNNTFASKDVKKSSTNNIIASGGAIIEKTPDIDLINNLLFLFPVQVSPTIQASGISFSNVTTTKMSISWTSGNGARRATFIKQASTGNASPVNAITYTANTTFGSGTQIGSSGWYCIYNGTGTTVDITGLTLGTDYIVEVFDYNGTLANPTFNTATATNNPKTQTTLICDNPVIGSQATAAQTQCINGAFNAISVTATGTGISYQWYSNTLASTTLGTPIVVGTNLNS